MYVPFTTFMLTAFTVCEVYDSVFCIFQQRPYSLSPWWRRCYSLKCMQRRKSATPTLSPPPPTDSPSLLVDLVTQPSSGSSLAPWLVVSRCLSCFYVNMIVSMSPFLSSPHMTHASTALTDTATLRGSYNFYLLANDAVTEYLRNYNLTTLPYHYYQYIQS